MRPIAEKHLGALMTWHIEGTGNGGLFSLGEVSLQPGDEPPLHIHAREDEAWYILDGTILFQRGSERILRHAGDAILLPRGIPHGFAVQSPTARILHFYAPGGIEQAFHSLSVPLGSPPQTADPDVIAAVFQPLGVTFVGPPLPVLLANERATT